MQNKDLIPDEVVKKLINIADNLVAICQNKHMWEIDAIALQALVSEAKLLSLTIEYLILYDLTDISNPSGILQ